MRWRGGTILAAAIAAVLVLTEALAATARPVPTETIETPTGGVTIPDSDTDPALSGPAGDAGAGPFPPIEYDVSKLPVPVRRLREQLMEAARSGDVEKLRPIIDANPDIRNQSFREAEDPIDFLKSQSGDPEGREILAILLEVLEAGYVHADVGTPQEMYIWPYFARHPLSTLTGPQMVELFKLITWGDFDDMRIDGAYVFFRVGITPSGAWQYFETGN